MTRACAVCQAEFEAKTARAKYCTTRCKDKGKPSASGLTCCICGEGMTKGKTSGPQDNAAHNKCRTDAPRILSHGTTGYRQGCRCEPCKAGRSEYIGAYVQSIKAEHGLHPNTLRRKRFAEVHGYWPEVRGWIAPKLRHSLYERDNWTCQLCQEPIDREAHWNTNYAPSLDHIVPQSHTLLPDHRPSNLRTAHRVCNSLRGATVDA